MEVDDSMPKTMMLLCLALLAAINIGNPRMILADHDKEDDKSRYQETFDKDDDDHREHDELYRHRKRYRKRHHGDDHVGGCLNPVTAPIYKENCGGCHLAYQPELLPSKSWRKILDRFDDHHGESLELDAEDQKVIRRYLETNAAERSTAKLAVNMMRSLGSRTPTRITESPYIIDKHREISASIVKRKSIGSLSNCSACHRSAEKGIYDDDSVVIPK
jgi:hypothetical protein